MFFLRIAKPNIAMLVLVLRYAERTLSRIMFSLFILAQSFWITINSLSFRPGYQTLGLARLTIFAATFHVFFFFLFIYTFLEKKNTLNKKVLIPLIFGLFI